MGSYLTFPLYIFVCHCMALPSWSSQQKNEKCQQNQDDRNNLGQFYFVAVKNFRIDYFDTKYLRKIESITKNAGKQNNWVHVIHQSPIKCMTFRYDIIIYH